MESTLQPLISVISPVYGCAACLRNLHRRVTEALSPITANFELILVNDHSRDGAWEVIGELCATDRRVVGIDLSRNFGQHIAIAAGLDRCKGEWVVVMDCDLQDRPEEIPRLSAETVPSAVPQAYAYDWHGLMLTRTVESNPVVVNQYQYGPDGNLLEEQTAGVAQSDYVWLDGQPVAMIQVASGTVNYLVDDRLGQPRVAVKPTGSATTGTVVWTNATSPFGRQAVSGALAQNLRLPGQVADPNIGWYHNGQRDYLPGTGRYLETDTIGLAGGISTYGYALQNPLKYIDPRGLAGSEGGSEEDDLTGYAEMKDDLKELDEAYRQIDNVANNSQPEIMPAEQADAMDQVLEEQQNPNQCTSGRYTSKVNRNIAASDRRAYWMSQATDNPDAYSESDLENMASGKAPTGDDGYPVELHHEDGTTEGDLVPMTRAKTHLII